MYSSPSPTPQTLWQPQQQPQQPQPQPLQDGTGGAPALPAQTQIGGVPPQVGGAGGMLPQAVAARPVPQPPLAPRPTVATSATQLAYLLGTSDTLREMCMLAWTNVGLMDAIHYSTICDTVSRRQRHLSQQERREAPTVFGQAAAAWVSRPPGSIGRGAANAAIMVRAAASMRLDVRTLVQAQLLLVEAARLAHEMYSRDVMTCLFALQRLGVTNSLVVGPLAAAAAAYARQGNRYAGPAVAATLSCLVGLGVTDSNVLTPFIEECGRLVRDMDATNAAAALLALARLGVADEEELVRPLAITCVELVRSLHPHDAADCLLALAMLDEKDQTLVRPIATACAVLAEGMAPPETAGALWAMAVLGLGDDDAVVRPVAAQAARSAPRLSVADAERLLQAHLAGVVLTRDLQRACWELVNSRGPVVAKPDASDARRWLGVAAALDRLGIDAQVGVPMCGGLLEVPVLARPRGPAEGAAAIEIDGPARFLRPPMRAPQGSIGKISGATSMRRAMLRSLGAGDLAIVVVPFFEWDSRYGDAAREEALLVDSLRAAGLSWPILQQDAGTGAGAGADAGADAGAGEGAGAGAGAGGDGNGSTSKAGSSSSGEDGGGDGNGNDGGAKEAVAPGKARVPSLSALAADFVPHTPEKPSVT